MKKHVPLLTATALSVFFGISSFAMADSWKFEQENARLEIDTQRSGQITRWEVGGKVLVDAATPVSPLHLETSQSRRYSFVARQASQKPHSVQIRGALTAGQESIPATLAYRVEEKGQRIHASIQIDKVRSGDAVSELSWSLPLSLEPRKRIWFQGDHGFEWDTRYFYQFMAGTTSNPLTRPERNEWRYFGLDQLGAKAFRLWKSESTQTSPLTMQEGKIAVPAVQLYNADGGITVEYPALSAGAPRSLRVDASGSGEVKVLFWSRSTPAAKPEHTGQFGVPHEIILTAQSSEESALKVQKELPESYPVTPQPTPQQAMEEDEWLRKTPQSSALQYVTSGYPFAPGELRDAKRLRVQVSGKSVPVQAAPSAFWPDGSLKWVLLTFPIDASKAVATSSLPRVSLRDGKFLPVKVTQEQSGLPSSPATLTVEQLGDTSAKIINGDWSVEFATGSQWLRALSYKNRSLLRSSNEQRLAYTDYLLNPTEVLPYELEAKGGQRDAGTLKVDKITVEETGPLRAVVRLEGMTDNQEPTRVILRVEILAGRPELRLTHTAEFRFKDPRETFLTGMGLALPLAGQVSGKTDEALTLQLSYDHNEERLKQSGVWQVASKVDGTKNWEQLKTDQLEITGIIRNFQQTAPKALAADYRSGTLRFELWPSEGAPMDVRRYSNYPHRSQGESVPADEDWVQKHYYPEDPFIGITRSHEMLLAFWPKTAAPAAEVLSADFQSPPLLYAGWENYQSTGVVLPAPSQKEWPHAWQAWTNLANFWLWHQKVHQWYGFWTFGDIRHLYQNGYGVIVSPEVLAKEQPWKTPEIKLPREATQRDYQPPNDWAYDNGRWGWGSTEGLPNLFLQQEYLRHGNRAVYFASEALARISRDVVTRHEGKWFGRGTRHGVQHWSDGNHEERQTTITEYRLHYFLSGDGRSRDTINKLYDGVYSQTPVEVHAAHSGRLGGLLFHWEMTGSQEEAEQFKRYVELFVSPEGIYTTPSVKFPGPVAAASPRDLNGRSMFFHHFGAMHALIEYQQMTGDPQLAAAIIKMADATMSDPDVLRRYKTGKDGGAWPAIAFAAAHASDPAPYRQLLTEYVESGGWRSAYQTVTQNPEHWSGDTGYMSSSVPGSWFWTNWAPYLTQSLGTSEVWTPTIEEQFEKRENEGNPGARLRPSWQNQYDGIPELDEYLGTQQPWKQKN